MTSLLGAWRGALYGFSPLAWATMLPAALAGLTAPAALSQRVLVSLLMTNRVWLLLAPPMILSARPASTGIPRLGTPLPLIFFGSFFISVALLVAWNRRRRQRTVRHLLETAGDLESARTRERLEAYFAALAPAIAEFGAADRVLFRALRRSWWPGERHRRAAAAALRHYAELIERHGERPRLPLLAELEPARRALERTSEETRQLFLTMASEFEAGKRVPWRKRLRPLSLAGLELERDLDYALVVLAKSHRVTLPAWFSARCAAFRRAALTPADVTVPPRTA